jgi:DNA helicase IV
MSSLGKILLWVALVGALAAACAGGALIYKRSQDAQTLAQVQTNVSTAQQSAKVANKKAEDATQQATEATSKLATAEASAADLKSQLATLQKQATDAATALVTAQASAKDATDALTAIKASLGDETPDQYKADKQKAESDLAAALAEQKIMQDQVQSLQKQVSDAQDEINRSKTATNLPGVSG